MTGKRVSTQSAGAVHAPTPQAQAQRSPAPDRWWSAGVHNRWSCWLTGMTPGTWTESRESCAAGC